MRASLLAVVVSLGLVGLVGLTGCQAAPVFTPAPLKDVPPVFSSEEEALAAAEQVMAKYIEASNLMGRSGGSDLTGFHGIVSDEQLADEQDEAASLREAGKRLDGSFGYYAFKLQQYHEDGAPGAYLQAYVCADLTNVKYFNAEGALLNADGHALSIPYEVVFMTDGPKPPFLIEKFIRWTGGDFCER